MSDLTIDSNPQTLGLPHSTWRSSQFSGWQTSVALHQNGGGFLFIEAPTGVGKSGIATALGAHENVTVLVGTLNLLDQYHSQYGFSIIKGRANYACADDDKIKDWGNPAPTAADCHHRDMHQCDYAGNCAYLQIKTEALSARRLAVTYPYAMLSTSIRNRPGILVCDEAHSIVDEIIDFCSFEITAPTMRRWSFPEFPLNSYGLENKGDLLDDTTRTTLADWLIRCKGVLGSHIHRQGKLSRAYSTLLNIDRNFTEMMSTDPALQFLEVHPTTNIVMRLRPLTARNAARVLFDKSKKTVVLMSATLGDPGPLASELGLDSYHEETYPHPIPPDFRPVFDLQLPRMTHENLMKNPNLYRVQAMMIRGWISTLDPAWRGIILTPSYTKIKNMADVLVPACPERRFVVQSPGNKVSDVTETFIRDRRPGDILIASIQGFGHGLDLKGDLARWCVVAGVPHANPFDRYEQLRKQSNGKYGWWQAFSAIPQAAGRVSRGELDENGEYLLNVCALADGSATTNMAKKYYPGWFVEAIRAA